MLDRSKKKYDDEMLVTHKPVLPKEKMGRDPGGPTRIAALSRAEIQRLRSRFAVTGDPEERAAILETFQQIWGNEATERLLKTSKDSNGEAGAAGAAERDPGDEEPEG